MKRLILCICALWMAGFANAAEPVRGFSLTEIDVHKYDALEGSNDKSEAQQVVDQLYNLGVRQINLSPRAVMTHPKKSELVPMTPPDDRAAERRRYLRFINYIHSKGMAVGIRPIFFVVDQHGKTPYVEELSSGEKKIWWHGNIQPEDPNAWFESYKTYLDLYLPVAKIGKVEEFTIGAELYSMTVGIEDQWKKFPYGFPGRWLELLNYVRGKLLPTCRIMYDINFTDDKVEAGGLEQFGGEFARWRYRIVDLANPTSPEENKIWKNLVDFWRGLDAVGIDMYRSLATKTQQTPNRYDDLVGTLQQTSDRYASQIDNALFEIENTVGKKKELILKEIGYRSVEKGFVDPFVYAGVGTLSLEHQAAAYEAIFRSFWKQKWEWFRGIVFWDASVDKKLQGPKDIGFSPIGKEMTEQVLKTYFK